MKFLPKKKTDKMLESTNDSSGQRPKEKKKNLNLEIL